MEGWGVVDLGGCAYGTGSGTVAAERACKGTTGSQLPVRGCERYSLSQDCVPYWEQGVGSEEWGGGKEGATARKSRGWKGQ